MTDRIQSFLQSDASRADKCFSIIHSLGNSASTNEIRSALIQNGLRVAKDWNIASILGRTKGLSISIGGKWKLTTDGLSRASELGFSTSGQHVSSAVSSLREKISALSSHNAQGFLEETVTCLENRCYRAAIIMSWVAAVALLHTYIASSHLAAFNAEALKRDPKWQMAKSADDLSRIKEGEFLDISSKIGAIQKNVKTELKNCLDRRNACGHPTPLLLSELTAAHHIEVLVLNVYSKYS